jgi:4-oxalocrotonate tautomerase
MWVGNPAADSHCVAIYATSLTAQAVGAADDKIMGVSCVHQEYIMPFSRSRLAAACMLRVPSLERGQQERNTTIPLIEVHLIEKVFNPEQKRQIIQKLTDAMVSIEGENMRGVTWVKISEVASGEWGIGGKPLTTEAVKELAAGRYAA